MNTILKPFLSYSLTCLTVSSTYSASSFAVAELCGTGLIPLTEKFILRVSLSAPALVHLGDLRMSLFNK